MTLHVLSADDIDRALTAADAVAAMESAFAQLSDGRARVPVRGRLESARGSTLLMPAYLEGSDELGAKIVSVFPDNAERGEPPVQGAVLLLDARTGRPVALLDGTRLTALRTAAGSALATELLADPEADVLAVFGVGAQGRAHAELLAATRPLAEIRLVSRTGASAARLAEALEGAPERLLPPGSERPPPRVRACDPDEALTGAGIVVTATTSATPVFDGRALEPGAHVNAIGSYRPDMQEVDEMTILRARIVVDQRDAVWEEAGDLLVPLGRGLIDREAIAAELGEIVLGEAPRGRCGREITLFESVGNAAQDIASASAALDAARRLGLGTILEFTGAGLDI